MRGSFKWLIPISFLFIGKFASAQTNSLNLSYFGHYGVQPGARVSADFLLESLSDKRQILLTPQFGFFARPNTNNNFVLGVELGYPLHREEKKFDMALSAGLAYWLQSHLRSFSVNLATGDRTNKIRESEHLFSPTINLKWGQWSDKQLGWFTKTGLGLKIGSENGTNVALFIDAGISYQLSKP